MNIRKRLLLVLIIGMFFIWSSILADVPIDYSDVTGMNSSEETTGTIELLTMDDFSSEQSGESNTIKSFCINALSTGVNILAGADYPGCCMPSDRVFIITDILTYGAGEFTIRIKPIPEDIGFPDDNCSNLMVASNNNLSKIFSFNSGILIGQNMRPQIKGSGNFVISGYEFCASTITPAPSPTPTIFIDKFDDGNLTTPPWQAYSGSLSVTGVLHTDSNGSIFTYNGGGFVNGRIKIKPLAQPGDAGNGNWLGSFYIGFRKKTGFYGMVFYMAGSMLSNEGRLYARLYSDANSNLSEISPFLIFRDSQFFGQTIKLEVQDNTMKGFLNDFEIVSATDPSISGPAEAEIGLNAGKPYMEVDDFSYEEIEDEQ